MMQQNVFKLPQGVTYCCIHLLKHTECLIAKLVSIQFPYSFINCSTPGLPLLCLHSFWAEVHLINLRTILKNIYL